MTKRYTHTETIERDGHKYHIQIDGGLAYIQTDDEHAGTPDVERRDNRMNIRGIDADTVRRLKQGAASRNWTIARYVRALALLHEACRARADAGDDGLGAELTALGLETRHA